MTSAEFIFDAYKHKSEYLKKALQILVNLLDALAFDTNVESVTRIAVEYIASEAPLELLEDGDGAISISGEIIEVSNG